MIQGGAQSRKHALYYVEEEGCDQLVKTSSRCGFVFFAMKVVTAVFLLVISSISISFSRMFTQN